MDSDDSGLDLRDIASQLSEPRLSNVSTISRARVLRFWTIWTRTQVRPVAGARGGVRRERRAHLDASLLDRDGDRSGGDFDPVSDHGVGRAPTPSITPDNPTQEQPISPSDAAMERCARLMEHTTAAPPATPLVQVQPPPANISRPR